MRLALVPILFFAAALSCNAVQPPQITAETVTTGRIGPQGADMEATLSVFNPNKSSLTASRIESKITIGDKPEVARATITDSLILPPGQKIKIKLPIHIDWTNPAAISDLASTKQPASYAVSGTVSFTAAKGPSIQTPFQVSGVMTPDELARAAGKASATAPSASAASSAR